MAQRGVARFEVEIELGGVIYHHHDVDAGVDFGVVVGALRHAEQRVHFGQPLCEQAAFAQNFKHARGCVFHQSTGDFLPDALGYEGGGFAVRDHRAH